MARSAQIKLSDVATSRVNNLNFMRFIAALMVIVSHCYSVVLGGDAGSYLLKVTGGSLESWRGFCWHLLFVWRVFDCS